MQKREESKHQIICTIIKTQTACKMRLGILFGRRPAFCQGRFFDLLATHRSANAVHPEAGQPEALGVRHVGRCVPEGYPPVSAAIELYVPDNFAYSRNSG